MPRNAMKHGIVMSEDRIVAVSGTSQRQTFTYYQRKESGWALSGTVELSRPAAGHDATTLVFPDHFQFCEQTFQEGSTTFTVVTGCLPRKNLLFQRMRCDQPGALSVFAKLTPHHHVEARSLHQQGETASQLWLLPFEAETEVRDQSLVIAGEGELLMIWHFQEDHDPSTVSWQSFLREFDPEATAHLDLHVVADRLQAEASTQSPGQK